MFLDVYVAAFCNLVLRYAAHTQSRFGHPWNIWFTRLPLVGPPPVKQSISSKLPAQSSYPSQTKSRDKQSFFVCLRSNPGHKNCFFEPHTSYKTTYQVQSHSLRNSTHNNTSRNPYRNKPFQLPTTKPTNCNQTAGNQTICTVFPFFKQGSLKQCSTSRAFPRHPVASLHCRTLTLRPWPSHEVGLHWDHGDQFDHPTPPANWRVVHKN